MAKRLLALTLGVVGLLVQCASAQTYTLSPMPRVPFLDTANGDVPLANGKICTYIAGTSTPVFTFLDANGTQNANPVRTDGNGMATIYLAAGSSYKYIVLSCANGVCGDTTCSTGTVLYTQDGINAVPTGSANVDVQGVAGETINAGQCAYLSDGSGGKTAARWYKCDAANTYSSTLPELGLVPASITSGNTGSIRLSGSLPGLSSLSAGAEYFVGTAGALTSTAPTNVRHLGHADSVTSLILTGNPPSATSLADNTIDDFRLTLTTATPVTTADVTAATTLFLTPYRGNRIALYNGSAWVTYATPELSIAVPATTSQMYDVFAFDNAGTRTLELTAWTSDTTRATALVTQDGVLVKTGALTHRYVGSCRTTTVSGQTENSAAKRYVWNYYNRIPQPVRASEATNSWTYTLATWHQANASTANQVAVVNGVAEGPISLTLLAQSSSSGGTDRNIAIGENSTTVVATGSQGAYATGATGFQPMTATLTKVPPIGLVTYVWLESSAASGTTTWFGTPTSTAAGNTSNGLQGMWAC